MTIDFLESEEGRNALIDCVDVKPDGEPYFEGEKFKEWLKEKILARDKEMRREGFEAGKAIEAKPANNIMGLEIKEVFKSFEDFESKRSKGGGGDGS